MVVKNQKPLAIIVAVVMVLLLIVGTAVPAFAAEPNTTVQSNEQFVGGGQTTMNGLALTMRKL